ncbi:MAG: hypothetical protein U1E53_22410 [Dongiaceae bacterium]
MFLLGGARREVISTEFSRVQLWDKNLNAPSQLPGPPANLCDQVNRMIEAAAAGTPVSFSRFQGFLRGQTSWYPKTQNGLGWFAQFYCMFHRRPNVSVVTYGLERSPQYPYELDLLETDPPGSTHCKAGVHSWVMISAYDGATMGTNTSRGSASFGSFNANPLVFPEFEKVVGNPAKVCADLTPWP